MEAFGLIDKFKEYCDANNIEFLYGDNFYQNIEASQREYAANQLVLGLDLNALPDISDGGAISQILYTGQILLGRKFETVTGASLDESYWQKYERRLKDLSTILTSIIITIQCANELSTQAFEIRFDINKFDTNIDFVVANITFVQ